MVEGNKHTHTHTHTHTRSLNINDSVRRLLKMANLSCIHIPVEVFQSSEVDLEPCRTSTMKRFCEICQLVSKYAIDVIRIN